MTANAISPNLHIYTDNQFSVKELLFIAAYLANGFKAGPAVIEAGYKSKAPDKYGTK